MIDRFIVLTDVKPILIIITLGEGFRHLAFTIRDNNPPMTVTGVVPVLVQRLCFAPGFSETPG